MKQLGFVPVLVTLSLVAAPALADGGANHQVKQSTPVKMGTSGGSVADSSKAFCCGGTLGALVTRDGVLSILSNNHVLARSGSAATEEDTIQPGLIDIGCRSTSTNSNIVGDFAGNVVPLGTANVDVGLSIARSNVDSTGAIIDVGVPCSSPQNATVGLPVAKSGRTTGYTTGTVQATNASVSIQYQKGCNSGKKFTVSYTDQVVITGSGSFSAGGDSGSLIVSNDGTPNPVGLLFAGNSTQTIANPIADVVSALQAGGHTVSFVGSACSGLTSSSALGGSKTIFPTDAELDFTRVVKERYETELFERAGVIGVGVGADETDSSRGAIIVYLSTAAGSHPNPRSIPTELDGVPVRVIPTEPFVAQ